MIAAVAVAASSTALLVHRNQTPQPKPQPEPAHANIAEATGKADTFAQVQQSFIYLFARSFIGFLFIVVVQKTNIIIAGRFFK